MHNPMHVVAELRRPIPKITRPTRRYEPNPRRRHREFGPLKIRPAEFRCAHCDAGKVKDPPPIYHADKAHAGDPCPDCAGRGFNRVPLRRRPYLSWAFWRIGPWELYFPSLVTLWHVDPEADGTDSSCRNRYRPHWREAHADHDDLRKWFWWKVMSHYGWWHVRHWSVQVRPWQDLNRWLWSRCAHCGERFRWGYAPVSHSWDGDGPAWRRPERGKYHFECSDEVSRQRRQEARDVA